MPRDKSRLRLNSSRMPNDNQLVSKLAIGTVQFGLDYGIINDIGKTNELEVSDILDVAAFSGIEILDTAQSYGTSESVLGDLHQNRFKVITKLDLSFNNEISGNDLLKSSLTRLNLTSLYGVLFHDTKKALSHPNILRDVVNLKSKGVIEKIGFSVYDISEVYEIKKIFGLPDIIQLPFSHIDRRFENLAIELCADGVEVHSRSTFLQGLLLKNWEDKLHPFFKSISPYINSFCSVTDSIDERAKILLKFALTRPFIDYVIIGVNTKEQLLENLELDNIDMSKLPRIPEGLPSEILKPYLWPK